MEKHREQDLNTCTGQYAYEPLLDLLAKQCIYSRLNCCAADSLTH